MNKFYSFFAVFIFFISCKKDNNTEYLKFKGNIFGTNYSIIYKGKTNYKKTIDSIFSKFNSSLSTYDSISLISKINANKDVEIDQYILEAITIAKRIYKETEGYFDPTIGALVNAYGFGSSAGYQNLTPKEIEMFKKNVGFNKIQIKNNKIYKLNPNIKIDVNAYAKGLGVDVIGRYLESKGIKNYLIEIGGEIRVRGLKNNNPWIVGIENPNRDLTQSIHDIVKLTNKSMATSGNYRKYRIDPDTGKKFVHIVNPVTCLAQESNLLSASVIANLDCADVDAYATAFMAMGLEKTKQFLVNHPELKVILIYNDSHGKVITFKN